MPTRRQRQVSELIHRELSTLLMFEARDPRLAQVVITEVEATPDLQLAYVYFTVLGEAQEQADALAALKHAAGFLRTQLAGRLKLRLMPELAFALDKSGEYGRRIDQLLDRIKEEDQERAAPSGEELSGDEPGSA
jgi:ribosome-binding factor A